jgi:hypothetical protein
VEGSAQRPIGGAGGILTSWVTSEANPGLDIPSTDCRYQNGIKITPNVSCLLDSVARSNTKKDYSRS